MYFVMIIMRKLLHSLRFLMEKLGEISTLLISAGSGVLFAKALTESKSAFKHQTGFFNKPITV